jgi:hypothetical protein
MRYIFDIYLSSTKLPAHFLVESLGPACTKPFLSKLTDPQSLHLIDTFDTLF